jgi:TolB-like protein
MGRDESGTLARLREHRRERLEPTLARYGGRLVKLTGDGALVEFASAVDAVCAAIEFQQVMAEANLHQSEDSAIVFRIGLHVGDLIVDGSDLYGDGVNIAARLEAAAPPGGIIVSRAVREAVEGRVKAKLLTLGELALKNIERPIRAFRVEWEAVDWLSMTTSGEQHQPATPYTPLLPLPDKPSIAVLPFQNMSGDPEQEYFVDGLVEDIITALSRFKSLFVIARNSSFTYKGKAVDIKQVGRELGVRYVLEGSVRKAGNRVRITGQLIQADTGAHIWADRHDGDLADIFELQDKVTLDVVGAIAPKLQQAEMERAKRKPTESLDAYDYYLRGTASAYRLSKESVTQALGLLHRAIELDPEFASAHGASAWCYYLRRVNGWTTDPEQDIVEVIRLAGMVAELGKDDSAALSYAGLSLGHVASEAEAGIALANRALVLNRNLAAAWYASGSLGVLRGDLDDAIDHLARAMRLSPLDPQTYFTLSYTALAHFFAGRHNDAWPLAERACQEQQNFLLSLRVAAASNASAGRLNEARGFVARALQLDPELRISNLNRRIGPLAPDRFGKYAEALRMAGVPE